MTQLVLGLSQRGWLPRVYCLGPRGYFAEELEGGGIQVECLSARGMWSFPRVLRQLTRQLRQFRPALLQTFLFHANMAGRIAGRLAGVPAVVSGIRVADRRSRWYGRIDRWTNGLVRLNVCVSKGVADFAIQESRLNPDKIRVIPNGVDFQRFAQASPVDLNSLGISPKSPVVVTVGRLERQKGIGDLLQAAVEVLAAHPDCQFLIVGEGCDRSLLEARAASLGITNSVKFLGARSDIPGLLKASSLFVLPSLWEGMPNALLEAMAAGLPVIATAVEGSRELVESGVSGTLVLPANPGDLARAILKHFSAPEESARLAHTAQAFISMRFTESSAVTAYEQLYRSLIFRT